jgi:hypothetical protein
MREIDSYMRIILQQRLNKNPELVVSNMKLSFHEDKQLICEQFESFGNKKRINFINKGKEYINIYQN